MSHSTPFRFGSSVLLFGGLALAAGCAGPKTEGQKKMGQLSEQMQKLGSELTASKADVETLLQAHEMLVTNADADLRDNFTRFQRAIEKCDARQKTISTLMDQISATSTAYFAGWQADLDRIEDAALRQRSEERMEQVKGRLEDVQSQLSMTKQAFEPLLRTLNDHLVYLSNDLTNDAAASLSKDSGRLRTDIGSIYTAIDKVTLPVQECARALSTEPLT